MDKEFTVRDLIKELLMFPMDAPVYVGLINANRNNSITILDGGFYSNNKEIRVEDNGYPHDDGKVVFVK